MDIMAKKGIVQQQGIVSPLFIGKLLLSMLLLAWLASSLVQLANIMIPPESVTPTPSTIIERTPSNQVSSLPEVDIAALTSIPLFGKVVEVLAEPVEIAPKEEVVVETKLNLSLKGLFTSEQRDKGQAIIANGRKDQLYQVGDEIEGLSNVKLTAVFEDRVNLDNRGNAEVLYLYPESERLSSSANTTPTVSTFVDNNLEPEISQLDTNKPSSKKLNEIMRVVRERNKSTGEMLGFRVLPGRDREAFELSGLKVNDVITSIDGEALTDLRSAMTIYRNKRDATRVSLIIRRNDNEISLDLDLDKLNI